MRIAYFDCFCGISGDMTLGALVDAGVDPDAIRQGVGALGLDCEITFETVRRAGFRATHARVVAPPEHAHRHLHHIEAMVDQAGSALTHRAAETARRIFRKLGEAEAHAHGIDLRRVHFHEVGAVDSIADIVGAAIGLDLLGVDSILASPIPPGRGRVQAEHGLMPLPAPATAQLLLGIPLAESTADFEQTTPTGAAIVATVADSFGHLPPMTVERIGLGAGTRDPKGIANVLRLFIGDGRESTFPGARSDQVWILEANLDDLPGEIVGHALNQLLQAGALDAYLTPIQMKKNRPGVILTAICETRKMVELEQLIFRETTTLGIRRYPASRHKLNRKQFTVETPHGPILGKLGWIEGNPPTFSPEYEDCARAARERNVPLRDVYQAAHAAYLESRTVEAPSPPTQPAEPHSHPHDHDPRSH